MPPSNNPATTLGSVRLTTSNFEAAAKATNRVRAVNAAEPIAKPLPIAAVVLPRESSLSVIFLTSGPK